MPGVYNEWPEILQGTELAILWDLDALERDPATARMIREGRTMGCFYIESPSMRSLFQRMHCRSYRDVVAASSIIRPGVVESGMMKAYIERRRDPRKVKHLHPLLGEILAETYGVMVYQEDVMRVVHALGDMTLAEADILRRAMAGKGGGREAFASQRERFAAGCRAKGLAEETIAEIWRQIESFAGYSFCKGHSAAFAVLSYQVAYLKAHHPAEFMAAVLSNGGGYYGPGAYIQECRRMGLRVLAPDVNESATAYTGRTEKTEAGGRRREAGNEVRGKRHEARDERPLISSWVRVGVGAIKNLPADVVKRLVEARRERPFAGLEDFLARVAPGPEAAERLVRAGAFDRFGASRERLLLDLDVYFRTRQSGAGEQMELGGEMQDAGGRRQEARSERREGRDVRLETAGDSSAPGSDFPPPTSNLPLPTSDLARRMAHEIDLLGFGVSGHPLELLPPAAWEGTAAARDLRRHIGRRVTVIGWQITAKLIRTHQTREFMKFLSLEDLTDTFEVTLFPRAYRQYAPLTLSPGPFRVTGKVEDDLGALSVVAEKVEVLPAGI